MLAYSACHGKMIAPVTLRYSRVEALRIRNTILNQSVDGAAIGARMCLFCSWLSDYVLYLRTPPHCQIVHPGTKCGLGSGPRKPARDFFSTPLTYCKLSQDQ